jgi:hypothetical protein
MKKLLDTLKAAIADLSEWAAEKTSLEERRRKAQADIADAANEKLTPQIEAKIGRASNIIAVCDARLAHLETVAEEQDDEIREIYFGAKALWNKQVVTRRELARASFLNACLPFFDNDEAVTADRLAGIMPAAVARLSRGVAWSGFFPPPKSVFELLREIECFLSHVERKSEDYRIPID